jgi:hypothetical protein
MIKLKHPLSSILSGPSGCGKTVLRPVLQIPKRFMQREGFRRDRLVLQREWYRAKLTIYSFIKACQIFRTSGADRDT